MCRACLDGIYPIALPHESMIGKHVLEGVGRRLDSIEAMGADADRNGDLVHAQSTGGSDALRRP